MDYENEKTKTVKLTQIEIDIMVEALTEISGCTFCQGHLNFKFEYWDEGLAAIFENVMRAFKKAT